MVCRLQSHTMRSLPDSFPMMPRWILAIPWRGGRSLNESRRRFGERGRGWIGERQRFRFQVQFLIPPIRFLSPLLILDPCSAHLFPSIYVHPCLFLPSEALHVQYLFSSFSGLLPFVLYETDQCACFVSLMLMLFSFAWVIQKVEHVCFLLCLEDDQALTSGE
jgi:hypothetical protein